MRIIRKIFLIFIISITILFAWVNFKLYSGNFTKEEEREDILLQLNFLESELKNNNLADRMQAIFPEGFVFTNALYGLSWCEYGISDTSNIHKSRALTEALFAYEQINSEKAKSIFSPGLEPENGIYYLGWKNYLLSKILLLDANFPNSEEYKNIFSQQCALIISALEKSNTPFLPSYQNQTWPADMCVAMASISNYDKLFTPKYRNQIAGWVSKVKEKPDPKNGIDTSQGSFSKRRNNYWRKRLFNQLNFKVNGRN